MFDILKNTLALSRSISKALIYGPCACNNGIAQFYLPPTYEPFTPQPQGVTALWLVLISPTHEGTWVAGYIPKQLNPDTVTYSSTNRADVGLVR